MGDWIGVLEVCTGVVVPGVSIAAEGAVASGSIDVAEGDGAPAPHGDVGTGAGTGDDEAFCSLGGSAPEALLSKNSLVAFKKVLESFVDWYSS